MTSRCVQPSSLRNAREDSQGTKPMVSKVKCLAKSSFFNFYFKSFIYLRHYSFCVTLETPFKSLYSSGTDTLGFKHFTMLDS